MNDTTAAKKATPTAQRQEQPTLNMKAVLAAINDSADDPDTVKALNEALFRFGAQDPTMNLARSWQRVQRRIIDPQKEKADGVATEEQVAQFAARAGLTLAK